MPAALCLPERTVHAAKPERTFCASCGFPLRGQRCDICGSDQTPLHLAEGVVHDPRAALDESAAQGLERAFDAYRGRDLARFVGHVMTAEGGPGVRAFAMPEGPAWIAAIHGSIVFASINTIAAELSLQAPVVRVPRAQRVPVLRLALELGAQELPTARFCLREDLLVLRFGAPLATLAPLALRDLLREIGHLASRWAELFAVSFDAHLALDEAERATVGFEALGRTRKLRLGGSSGMMRSIAPPPPPPAVALESNSSSNRPDSVKTAPLRAVPRSDPMSRPDADRPSSPHGAPPLPSSAFSAKAPLQPPPPSRPAPPMGPAPAPMPKAELPEPVFELAASSVRPRPISEPIPAILAPMFVASGKPAVPVIPPLPPLPTGLSAPRVRQSMPEIDIEAPSRQPSLTMAAVSQEMREPADRLCVLLRQAKALASLVLENRPGTMPWLVRATVFRAIHEYRDVLPDAVAHLYRCTGTGRDAPEPALLVLDRVIAARAHHPGEKPLSVDPLTSAAQAKEHIGRYVAEIDRSPLDPALRHFLAVGALAELLARAKLPSQTELRLRDIVGHAQREGAKQGSIDLMMTALQRIAGG